jgi:carbon-monoxide dehydrogenase iron sulfur subunit
MKQLFINIDKCLACRSCEIACALAHSQSKDLFSAIHEEPKPLPRTKVELPRTLLY